MATDEPADQIIHVSYADVHPDALASPEPKDGKCPLDGGDLAGGWGLAGGGFGSYVACLNDGCKYFHKWPIPDEDV